ncbi:MAG: hypothetical protein K5894_09445 [Lachnospiraceae bacterium]|nr:hypothetical protein [Lachnospiraceae bacterium]
MRRKFLFRSVSIASSVILAATMPGVTVHANNIKISGGNKTLNDDVDTDNTHGIEARNKSEVFIDGDVVATGTINDNGYEMRVAGIMTNNSSVKVTGDVYGDGVGIAAGEGSFVTVGGDVTGGDFAIDAYGENCLVVVENGEVSAGGDRSWTVQAGGGAEVKIKGQVTNTTSATKEYRTFYGNGAIVEDSSKLTVDGNVITKGQALQVEEATVEITGNVQSTNSSAIMADNGSVIQIIGDVSANKDAILLYGDDYTVSVNGKVKSEESAAYIDITDSEGAGRLILDGTVGGKDYGIIIFAEKDSNLTQDEIIDKLPEISVYEFSSDLKKNIGLSNDLCSNEEEFEKLREKIQKKINYIIHSSSNVKVNSTYDEQHSLNTMKLDETVGVVVDNGYELTGSDTVEITPLATAGTYLVKIINPIGAVDLSAIKKAIADVIGEDEKNISIAALTATGLVDKYGAPIGAITELDNRNTGDAAQNTATAARIVLMELDMLTPAQYKSALIDNIEATPAGETLRIETDDVACLDLQILNAFVKKATIDIELLFNYRGKRFCVEIPAGYDITKLLDQNGYCGFLRLASILGIKAY